MKIFNCIICLSLLALSTAQTAPQPNSYMKQAAVTDIEGAVHIVADSPRPMAQVLDALQQKYGWALNYEDPAYISKTDIAEELDNKEVRKIPRGGRFTVDFPAGNPDVEKILQIVLDSYNRSGNPGHFQLRKISSDVFSIVGVESTGPSTGNSLLDIPVTFPVKERTATATLELLCKKLAELQKIAVTVGVLPRNFLDHAPVSVGGKKISARELLVRTLQATHHKLYWRLLFDPNSNAYFIDIHSSAVKREM